MNTSIELLIDDVIMYNLSFKIVHNLNFKYKIFIHLSKYTRLPKYCLYFFDEVDGIVVLINHNIDFHFICPKGER